jgi:OOP family OmpA-OmpF porin
MKNTIRICLALVFAVLYAQSLHGQPKDVAGSKDNPLISRYKGSYIIGYEQRAFEEFTLPLGKQVRSHTESEPLAKTQRVEGKHTRILYVLPEERSSLEVFRNYESSLLKAGFVNLFSCSQDDCGKTFHHVMYPLKNKLKNRGQTSEYAFSFPKDQRYMSAKLSRPEGDVYVSLYVAVDTFNHFKETKDKVLTLLQIVERKGMEKAMVTVDAAAMGGDIEKTGHVAIYGIYFDTDKADIKPASEPTLNEMAKFLSQKPKLKVFIVGHTDNAGTFAHNQALSQKRAEAVVKELTAKYKVSQARLIARGVASLAPVASNNAEAGRAKNRRVEMVEQ